MRRMLLCVAMLAFAGYAEWEALPPILSYGCGPGSGMCYGKQKIQEELRNSIWLLHGVPPEIGAKLDRYDIGNRYWEWVWYALLPQPPIVDWGGALTYVPNPNLDSIPYAGWIFALKGNNTQEFYVHPVGFLGGWLQAESIPDEVEAGGALCFGGIHGLGGLSRGWAYLYALSGKEEVGLPAARFFRYKFNIPGDGTSGQWEKLPPLPEPADRGSALAWVQLTNDPTALGNVMALPGGGSYNIWKYNASRNLWELDTFGDYPVYGGGAMATGPGGHKVWCFPGGGQQVWWLYDIVAREFRYFTTEENRTPYPQNPGSAMAFDGTTFLYAEFGGREFSRFSLDEFGKEGKGGSQGSKTRSSPRLSVRVVSEPTRCILHFHIKSQEPGPVTLRLFDPVGRLVEMKHCDVSLAETELEWNYSEFTPGVYYYRVESKNRIVSDKLTVMK